ncbi:MAG: phosphopantetheine-binding protein [Acidobacteriota bacterium]
MSRPEIHAILADAIADSLAIPVESVTPDSRLVTDLGADSLDFIDILFVLEKKLDIRLRDSELSFLSKLDFSSPAVMRDGALTPETLRALEGKLPALKDLPDRSRVTPAELFGLISVDALAAIVERELADRARGETL